MSNILKIVILSPLCQLGGMFAGGAAGTLVHGALPGHTMDLGRILPAAFFAQFGLLPMRNLFTLLFVPAVFIVCFVTAWAMSVALRRPEHGARNALLAGLAGAVAFLVVNVVMDALGWQVGGPRAAERFTMLTVTFAGCLAASAALGAAIQVLSKQTGAPASA